jgi:NADH-quinone oxidoreductase subunit M
LLTILATVGLVAATAYSLRIVQRVFLGKYSRTGDLVDLDFREKLITVPLVLVIIWLGLFPQPIIDMAKKSLTPNTPGNPSAVLQQDATKGDSHE